MKKKLAALDMRIQFGAVAFLLLAFAYFGHSMVVAPQGAKAAKLQKQADDVQFQIYQRQGQIKKGLHPPTIQTADLFKLARAMPDTTDMPGIILTLSDLARSSGIKFDLIEPVAGGAVPSGSYETDRIHLLFNGDFYGLSDFLYRLRSLVAVHDGKLDATGRLFNVDTVTFNVLTDSFPKISAELFVNAYVYGATAPTTPVAPTTTNPDGTTTTSPTTTTTSSTDTTTTPPAGATAAGATP
jgi:Tfp pilus assembly protein PilO